jgi:hypothetical protein
MRSDILFLNVGSLPYRVTHELLSATELLGRLRVDAAA